MNLRVNLLSGNITHYMGIKLLTFPKEEAKSAMENVQPQSTVKFTLEGEDPFNPLLIGTVCYDVLGVSGCFQYVQY